MIKKVIEAEHSKLPFCKGTLPATHLESQPLFDLTKQYLSISITGLAQCVKILTEFELEEDAGLGLGLEIIEYLQNFAKEVSSRNKIQIILTDKAIKVSDGRFANLDLKYEV